MTRPCRLWGGTLDRDGYGRVNRGSLAHRVRYEEEVGPIPKGWEVDHLCCVRSCVEPTHLEAVTKAENRRRQVERQGACVDGHDLRSVRVNSKGKRVCRPCAARRSREYLARKKVAV